MTELKELALLAIDAFADAGSAERSYRSRGFLATLRDDPEWALASFRVATRPVVLPRREIPRAWWLRLADDARRPERAA